MRRPLILALFITSAAGAQWQILDAHTTADFRGVSTPSLSIVWVSGNHGAVLRSEDAGHLWQHCTTPPDADILDFRGIQAFDANTAIIMSSGKGNLSRLYKTTDGCETWKLVLTNPDAEGFFDAIDMYYPKIDTLGHPIDEKYAIGNVLGDPVNGHFVIFSTSNGGNTWQERKKAKRGPKGDGCKIDAVPANVGESAFAASNRSLVTYGGSYFLFVTGGSVSRIAFTRHFDLDGALCHESSHFERLPITQGKDSAGAFAMAAYPPHINHFNFPAKVVIVGGDYKQPEGTTHNALVITGLGSILPNISEPTTQPHGYRSAVAYDDPTKTWITVGPNGTDISTDDGRDWRPRTPSPTDTPDADKNWNALALPYVVGPHGRVGIFEPAALVAK